jgi:hypothetical protein
MGSTRSFATNALATKQDAINPLLCMFIKHRVVGERRICSFPNQSIMTTDLFGSNQGEEHVESNLDSVDKDKTMLGGDELEVDGVNNRPDLPRSLASREEVVLDLVTNDSEGISVDKSKVGEEDSHEDRAPEDLVDSDLEGDILGSGSGDLVVKPVVEVVTRRSVVKETKCRKRKEALHVECSSGDEDLCCADGGEGHRGCVSGRSRWW